MGDEHGSEDMKQGLNAECGKEKKVEDRPLSGGLKTIGPWPVKN
jgi:hypothetical protein